MSGWPSRLSGSGREALPDVSVWSRGPPNVKEWSEGLPGCPGVVGRPSRMSGSGREAISDVW